MEKLFTIRHGSHLYGTNTAASDIDLKTIYLPELKDLLVGKKIETFKERDAAPTERMQAGETEEEFIPLQTLAQHYLQNQSYALECVFAFISGTNVEYANPKYHMALSCMFSNLVRQFSNRNLDSIVGYAYSQSLKYGLKGERLDAIQRLISSVETLLMLPDYKNATIADIVEGRFTRDATQPIFITDIPATRSNEAMEALSIGNKLYAFNTTLKHFLKALNILKDKYGKRMQNALEGSDWKAISHAIRITAQGVEMLNTNHLEFPHGLAPYLLAVKQGTRPEEEAYARLEELFQNLKEAKETTELPELTNQMKLDFEAWLKEEMLELYIPKLQIY